MQPSCEKVSYTSYSAQTKSYWKMRFSWLFWKFDVDPVKIKKNLKSAHWMLRYCKKCESMKFERLKWETPNDSQVTSHSPKLLWGSWWSFGPLGSHLWLLEVTWGLLWVTLGLLEVTWYSCRSLQGSWRSFEGTQRSSGYCGRSFGYCGRSFVYVGRSLEGCGRFFWDLRDPSRPYGGYFEPQEDHMGPQDIWGFRAFALGHRSQGAPGTKLGASGWPIGGPWWSR